MRRNKEIRENKEEKQKKGKTNKRKLVRILLGLVLTAATVTASLSGIDYIGAKSKMNQLSSENNVSENGNLEESSEFRKLTDSYLQALELYLNIRRLGSVDGSVYTGKMENMPFLQTGTGAEKKVVTLKEAAGWKGHNYDYDGYLSNYINGFEKYSKENVSIYKKASQLLSLKQVYFARGNWEKSTLYYTVASGENFSKKDWKNMEKQGEKTTEIKRYDGQETLLPGLQGGNRETETMEVDLTKGTQKVGLHSDYARWLGQMYPNYAKGWLLYQMALAAENNFHGKGEDGTGYKSYYGDLMEDYRKAHRITDLYNIEENSKLVEDTNIVYVYDSLGEEDNHTALRLDMNDRLYYNGGKSDFTLKNFLKDPMAYYSDAEDNEEGCYVYDESLEKYTEEIKKKGQKLMENAIGAPWNIGRPLCNETMAADMAQFLLSFGKGLEDFLQKSGFLYNVTLDKKCLITKNEKWASYVDNLQRAAIDEHKTSYDYKYAIYDARGEVYQTNWSWHGFENSGDLKEFLKKMTNSHQNAYVVVGYPVLDITSPGKTSGMASLYKDYQETQKQYLRAKDTAKQSILIFAIGLLSMLLAFFGLAVTSTTTQGKERRIQKLPSEILAVAALVGIYLLNGSVYDLCHISNREQTMEQTNIGNISITRLADALLIAALALAVMFFLLELIQRICQKRLKEHSLIRWCFRKGKTGGTIAISKLKVFVQKYKDTRAFVRYGTAVIAFAVLWLVIWIVSWNVVVNYSFGVSYGMTVIVCVIGLPFLLIAGEGALLAAMRNGIADEKIQKGAERIAQGDISYQIGLPEKASKEQKELADTINHIRQGLESAVEESVRSERMKTELITNVSHDIKTPLTSVINYVDLLKREHIDNERAQEYLDVLDRKSMRLKSLIEDLVEASKASSGTIELQITTLNFGELVNQTNGEFEEKFEQAGLSLVAEISEQPVRFKGDGRRVFRILENLYGNVAKYALEGTRVYVTLSEKEDRITGQKMAEFSIKNISRERLDISPDELMERFVRGDASRTTEGSGLGLYIANNLMERMGGKFEIRLDGDLFHVTVSFPVEK